MFAVFSNRSIVYLGDDREVAMKILESKEGSTLKTVNTLAALTEAFNFYLGTNEDWEPTPEDELETDELSEAAAAVLEKLDEAGLNADNVNETITRLKSDGKRALTEVRSLGIKGMNVVGEGFVALGELLKQTEEPEPEPEPADESDSDSA